MIRQTFSETAEGKLTKMWSIKVEVQQITRVGHWISLENDLQNSLIKIT